MGKSKRQSTTFSFVSGGIAGVASKTILSPFERVKIMQQTGGGTKTTSLGKTLVDVYNSSGILGFWKGNGLNCLRIFPNRSLMFATNDYSKNKLPKALGLENKYVVGAISGAFGGISSTLATYPMDLVRTRLAGLQQETGTWACVKDIWLKEGFRGYYRGLLLTTINVVPYSAILFSVHNILLDDYKYSPIISGACAGMATGMVTFPFDTIRRILQSSGSDHMKQYSPKFIPTVKRLYQEEGILRFYRGGLMNMVRMGAQASVAFYTFETVKSLMHSVQSDRQIA